MRKVIQERPINLLAGAVALAVSCMPVLAQQKNPDRNAYFGEQHVHTSWATTSGSSSRSTLAPDNEYHSSAEPPCHHARCQG